MLPIILVIIAVVCFVVGISFVFNAYLSSPKSNQIVAVEEYEKLKKDFQSAKDFEQKNKAELESREQVIEAMKKDLERAQEDIKTTQRALDDLKANSAEEIYKEDINQLEKEKVFLLRKKLMSVLI